MKKDQRIYIHDIIESINIVLQHLANTSLKKFCHSLLIQDAVNKRVEEIGEIFTRFDPDFRAQHPELPWSYAISLRNRLAHDYDHANLEIIYNTVIIDLVHLKKQLQTILTQLND
jgi:uncharacterized protein with HEPN domain